MEEMRVRERARGLLRPRGEREREAPRPAGGEREKEGRERRVQVYARMRADAILYTAKIKYQTFGKGSRSPVRRLSHFPDVLKTVLWLHS